MTIVTKPISDATRLQLLAHIEDAAGPGVEVIVVPVRDVYNHCSYCPADPPELALCTLAAPGLADFCCLQPGCVDAMVSDALSYNDIHPENLVIEVAIEAMQ